MGEHDSHALMNGAHDTGRALADARARQAVGVHAMSDRERAGRYGVLVAPLVLVNSAAIYGQIHWATDHLTGGNYVLAVLFALTLESIAVYLAYEAHTAFIAGDASFRLRAASYLTAFIVGALNYSHFAADNLRPTTAALAFGGLSTISPWLWSIRSRSLRRDQLRAAGLIDPRSAHFAAAKWIHFPIRSLRTYRWAVDNGVQEERAAWDGYRQAAHARDAERARNRDARRNERTSRHDAARAADAHRQGDPRSVDQVRADSATSKRALKVRPAAGAGGDSTHNGARGAEPALDRVSKPQARELRRWINARAAAGEAVTGNVVGEHFGVSAATGRRWLRAVRAAHQRPDDPPSSTVEHARR